jgi:MFS family permease
MSLLERWLARVLPATPEERAAAFWSFAYFFMLLAGYYVLRPLRDQMGIAGGVKALPWMFTATFLTLIVAQPLYGALLARLPRARADPLAIPAWRRRLGQPAVVWRDDRIFRAGSYRFGFVQEECRHLSARPRSPPHRHVK